MPIAPPHPPPLVDSSASGPRRDAGGRSQEAERGSVVGGSLWMVVISLGLFFLPAINGLVGGLVGGYKAGSVPRALVAALLPAVVLSFGLWLLLTALEMPVLGVVAGFAAGALIVLADLGLFIGAALGGFLGRRNLP
jgi:hypothetical protein